MKLEMSVRCVHMELVYGLHARVDIAWAPVPKFDFTQVTIHKVVGQKSGVEPFFWFGQSLSSVGMPSNPGGEMNLGVCVSANAE